MKKVRKNLARKILCGLLAAGVVGVSDSALAAEYTDKYISEGTYNDDVFKLTNTNKSYNIDADGKEISILCKEISINSTSSAPGNLWGADAYGNGKLILGGENTESISIIAKNTASGNTYGILALDGNAAGAKPAHAIVTAKNLFIDVSGVDASGIHVGNNTDNGAAPANASSMTVKADTIIINSTNIGVSAYSHGQFNLKGDLTINAPRAIEARGNATMNINTGEQHKTVLNGDIVFGTPATPQNGHNSGSIINALVNVNLQGAESSWTGSAYQEYKSSEDADYSHIVELVNDPFHGNVTGFKMNISDGAAWNMTGNSFINDVTVANGGAINVEEAASLANLQNVTMNEGTISLKGNEQKVNIIDRVTGTGIVATNSLSNNVNVSEAADCDANITVQGTGDIADAIQRDASNAQKLADVVSTGEGEAKQSVASEVKTAEGKVGGAYYAKVDEHGNIDKASEVHAENTTNRAITDMASISIMTWRAENNDMNKRLGELRDSKGEHGAWAHMARGESKYGAQNVKNQYNYYQVGYDEKLSVDPNWTVGVALTRTEGTSTFTNGSGENKHTGFAVYGSYLADNGSFIDLIAKYARMDNDYKTVTGAGSGDYETNGYSLSAEYGKRFTKDNGFWIEPQVELTYGKISSADYLTANKVQVNQGDTNSIVGRLGFSLGKDIKQGNVYVRASYLYDFDGETDVKMVDTATGTPASYKQDLGGGWWEVGVGTNLNLSEATHLYFDVEKTYGGNVATPWQWNAGVRWSF